jgi:hypothetical protein
MKYHCCANTAPTLLQSCTVVSAALIVSHIPAQRSHLLSSVTLLIVKFGSILNVHPYLQVLSGAPENALAESESILHSSWGGKKNLEELRSTCEGYWSVQEVCIYCPDNF